MSKKLPPGVLSISTPKLAHSALDTIPATTPDTPHIALDTPLATTLATPHIALALLLDMLTIHMELSMVNIRKYGFLFFTRV